MSRAHIPPGFIHIEAVYPIGDDGELTVRCGAPGTDCRYEIVVRDVGEYGRATERVTGPTFTFAKRELFDALRGHPATLAAVRAVLEPKKRKKP